jgi:hypothetical protein
MTHAFVIYSGDEVILLSSSVDMVSHAVKGYAGLSYIAQEEWTSLITAAGSEAQLCTDLGVTAVFHANY